MEASCTLLNGLSLAKAASGTGVPGIDDAIVLPSLEEFWLRVLDCMGVEMMSMLGRMVAHNLGQGEERMGWRQPRRDWIILPKTHGGGEWGSSEKREEGAR